jgi:hypothetical protein
MRKSSRGRRAAIRPWRPARASAFQPVHQSTRGMEAATRSGAGNGAGKMALSGAGTADQHRIAPEEGASGEITY